MPPRNRIDTTFERLRARGKAAFIAYICAGDPTLAGRTWVVLTEAAEGGWGMFGTAFGKEEFAALAAKAAAAKAAS